MSQDAARPAAGESEYYEGASLYQEGRLVEAERVLRRGIERHREETQRAEEGTAREHPWCNSLLGVILSDRGRLDEAEERLRIAAEAPSSDFTDPGIVRNLALFLLQKRADARQAEEVLRHSLVKRNQGQVWFYLGYVLEVQRRWRDAWTSYLQAVNTPPPAQWKDWTVSPWYRAAKERFWGTTRMLHERLWSGLPTRRACLARSLASLFFLVLFLAGTVSLSESWKPDWLPVFFLSQWTQLALLAFIILPWVPYLIPHGGSLEVDVGTGGVRVSTALVPI